MNRGSASERAVPDVPRSGFNEAPIHESGKLPLGEEGRQAQAASMRPRFMNRGSAIRLHPSSRSTDSFNEAPIHESGKFYKLQRGDKPI